MKGNGNKVVNVLLFFRLNEFTAMNYVKNMHLTRELTL